MISSLPVKASYMILIYSIRTVCPKTGTVFSPRKLQLKVLVTNDVSYLQVSILFITDNEEVYAIHMKNNEGIWLSPNVLYPLH